MYRRPIVAPANWPLDEWQSLSEKDQIHWWLENGWRRKFPPRDVLRKKLRKAWRLYERGIVSIQHLFEEIRQVFDEECLREALAEISPENVERLRKNFCDDLPAVEDEEAWSKKKYGTAVNVGPDWTDDDFERLYWEFRSEGREFKRILQNIFPPS